MSSNTIKIISDPKKSNDDNLNTNHQMPSSGGDDEQVIFKPTKRGLCVIHGVKMKKLMISSKKWCDRGCNKDFGRKTSKVSRYVCEVRKNIQNQ